MVGTIVSHFRILAALGHGGMGVVYKAEDTRLHRTVALKFLSEELSRDQHAVARFRREALAVSGLNHPHVCAIYDIDEYEGRQFLVMEYLEGSSLQRHIAGRPLPLDQILDISSQIADALASAHDAGIIHRDIKPGNIFVTAHGAKLLDFGLATALRPAGDAGTETTVAPLTGPGVLLGTVGYMAPEQVRGEIADSRSDLFALGTVLYEMATGRQAFIGPTQALVHDAILHRAPTSILRVNADLPPRLDDIISRALEKDRQLRYQDAADLRADLQRLRRDSDATRSVSDMSAVAVRARWWHRWATAIGVAVLLVLLAVIATRFASVAPSSSSVLSPVPTMRFPLDAPPGELYQLALSPDGRQLAVTTYEEALTESGVPPLAVTLWVRRLDRPGWQRLPVLPRGFATWTPDSRGVVCVASDGLRVIDVASGASRVVAPSGAGTFALPMFDGSFLLGGGPRLERASRGGLIDEWAGDPNVLFGGPVAALPDGRYLFAQIGKVQSATGVFLCTPGPRQCTRVLDRASNVSLAAAGRIVFGMDGTLFSQGFHAATGRVTGEPETIVTDVAHPYGHHVFTQGADGTIVWRPDSPQWLESSLVWFDRAGRQDGTVGPPGPYRQIELSPDGLRLAVERYREAGLGLELVDISSATFTRVELPSSIGRYSDPIWSPDGTRVALAVPSASGPMRIGIVNVDRRGANLETMSMGHDRSNAGEWPEDWSSDGQHIIHHLTYESRSSLWSGATSSGGPPVRLTPEGATADQGQLSPDDRWVAYTSDETGRIEVYVQPFLREGPRRRVSSGGGGQPRWRGDGRELFYLTRDGAMMSVTFSPAMEPAAPKQLFRSSINANPLIDKYVVTAAGQRFLGLVPVPRTAPPQMAVLVNWQPKRP
jgi:eukaryotic-like serine/threonine-protein kinase